VTEMLPIARPDKGDGDVVVDLSLEVSLDLNWQELDHCIAERPRIVTPEFNEERLSSLISV
jgi:hypothetical protein